MEARLKGKTVEEWLKHPEYKSKYRHPYVSPDYSGREIYKDPLFQTLGKYSKQKFDKCVLQKVGKCLRQFKFKERKVSLLTLLNTTFCKGKRRNMSISG